MSKCTETHVRRAYMKLRREIHPKFKPHPRWKPCWPKIADTINNLGCDVMDYVSAQFKTTYPFPHPNTMYSQTSVAKYALYIENNRGSVRQFEEDVAKRLDSMTGLLERKLKMGFSVAEVLSNDMFPLIALFRVAMCSFMTGSIDEVKEFIDEARVEYDSHPAYPKTYAPYIDWNNIT